MDADKKKSRQVENLNKARALNILANSPEYVNVLLPYLKKLAEVPYIDPIRFKTDEEFMYALKSANARAGAYAELLSFLAQQEMMMNKLREDMDKPPKSYGI